MALSNVASFFMILAMASQAHLLSGKVCLSKNMSVGDHILNQSQILPVHGSVHACETNFAAVLTTLRAHATKYDTIWKEKTMP